MEDKLNLIKQFVDNHKEEIMQTWKDVVYLEGKTDEKENVEKVAARFKEEFEKVGFECTIKSVGDNACGTLVGVLGSERAGKPIIFSGHMDTVYPKGSWDDKLFEIEGNKVHGPGVLDMKGGIVIALYVAKALEHIGFSEAPIKIILSGNEENGHYQSEGANVFLEESKGGLFAMNMETGRIDNSLCIGRKGCVVVSFDIEGIGAHAGNDFESGRNAILEAGYKMNDVANLTNLEKGTTCNVGTIKGGTVSNAIPEFCTFEVDSRFKSKDELERLKEAFKEIESKVYIEGTKTTLRYGRDFAMYETTEGVDKFYDYVTKTAAKFDFEVPGSVYLGGGSDAAYVTLAGTPCVCAFGVLGQWNHTKEEYALIDSMYERIALCSAVVLNHKEFN
ncbi:MAG: M20/M25/M40 family metallo-hydrolase [Coprobacillus sp.]